MEFIRPSKLHLVWVAVLMGATCASLPAIEPERGVARGATVDSKNREMLEKACRFLWSKQSQDGAWRSETYGLLKSGQSLTPFVLLALSEAHGKIDGAPSGRFEKAMVFLRSMGNGKGAQGKADPDILDYPNYATAYALRCFLRHGDESDHLRIQAMVAYLLNQQFTEKMGFGPESVVHGGWGFGITRRPTLATFVDLAHTRRVLEALADANAVSAATGTKVEKFLSILQKNPLEKRVPIIPATHWKKISIAHSFYDGGFFSSPNVSYANKGRIAKDPRTGRPYYSSYATATCDGVLSLLAVGASAKDPRVNDAAHWLARNEGWELPAGIPAKHPEPWCESMIYYHLAVRAEAYAKLDMPGDWPRPLSHFLAKNQGGDGSFTNSAGLLMKEDDPILCSALAVTALSHALPAK